MIKKPRPQLTRTVVVRHDCSWAVTGKVCELSNSFQVFTPNEMVIVSSDRRPEACCVWCLLSTCKKRIMLPISRALYLKWNRGVLLHMRPTTFWVHVCRFWMTILGNHTAYLRAENDTGSRFTPRCRRSRGFAWRSHFHCATWHPMLRSSKDNSGSCLSSSLLTCSRRDLLVFTQHASFPPCLHNYTNRADKSEPDQLRVWSAPSLHLSSKDAGIKCAVAASRRQRC